MNKKLLSLFFVLFLVVQPMNKSNGTTIIIDGKITDWDQINPAIVEEDIHEEYFLDLQRGYITANETHLFVRIDYSFILDHFDSLMSNVTIRTPDNNTYILMAQVIYEEGFESSYAFIFHGRNISSPYNDPDIYEAVAEYTNYSAVNLETISIETAYLLADLNLSMTDSIDASFWHYDALIVGETVYLGPPRSVGTVYNYLLNEPNDQTTTVTKTTTETETITETATLNSTETETVTDISTTGEVSLNIVVGIAGLIALLGIKRKWKKKK